MLVVTWPPSAPPIVRRLAFIPVATPVCSAGTDSTMTFGMAEKVSPTAAPISTVASRTLKDIAAHPSATRTGPGARRPRSAATSRVTSTTVLGYRPAAAPSAGSAAPADDLVDERGDDLMQVTDHTEVGELEDRRLRVLVDRRDDLGGLHARPVLDRPGDPGGEVQLRRDGLAGLAHLVAVRVPAGVDGRPGRPDRGAEQVGEPFHQGEVLGAAQAAAAGHDDRGVGQLRPARALPDLASGDRGRRRGLRQLDRHL